MADVDRIDVQHENGAVLSGVPVSDFEKHLESNGWKRVEGVSVPEDAAQSQTVVAEDEPREVDEPVVSDDGSEIVEPEDEPVAAAPARKSRNRK